MSYSGWGQIDAHDVPTITHELIIGKLSDRFIPVIFDNILDHRDTYMRVGINEEVDFIVKPSLIMNAHSPKIIIYLDMKPKDKIYRYIIDVKSQYINDIIESKCLILLNDDKLLLSGLPLSESVINDLVRMKSLYDLFMLMKPIFNPTV